MIKRPLYQQIWKKLSRTKNMIFLAGPRQTGKTTFARILSNQFTNHIYFNWDLVTNKKLLIEKPTFFEEINRKDASVPLVILDEIHKYKNWKNYLKGIYDHFADVYKFFILGSGRLNVFQKGGDSLAGRYFLFNLWPLTLAELAKQNRPFKKFIKDPLSVGRPYTKLEKIWKQLSELSGFPEPYLSRDKTVYRRWSRNYKQQLIREDIRNMTEVRNIDSIETLFALLPSKIGSPFPLPVLTMIKPF